MTAERILKKLKTVTALAVLARPYTVKEAALAYSIIIPYPMENVKNAQRNRIAQAARTMSTTLTNRRNWS